MKLTVNEEIRKELVANGWNPEFIVRNRSRNRLDLTVTVGRGTLKQIRSSNED